MKRSHPPMIGTGLILGLAIAACSSTAQAPAQSGVAPARATSAPTGPSAQARADSARHPYTAADIQFMSGMIHHHAQAVLIAGWAPTHGGSDPILRLTERIVVGQNDEIALMSRWLRDRGETVPTVNTSHDMMPGMDHSVMMPGMLSPEQLAQLDSARGPQFDRLFLTFMIQHHKGAITMVDQLFGSEGATQDETSFRLASDIYADQTTEINRMQRMLDALPPGDHRP